MRRTVHKTLLAVLLATPALAAASPPARSDRASGSFPRKPGETAPAYLIVTSRPAG